MLKTKDKRKLITNKKHLAFLRGYVKTFDVKLHLVRIQGKPEILELDELAPALCDPTYNNQVECKIVKPEKKSYSSKIRTFITKKLLSKKPVSLKDLKQKFKELNVTDACLSNHFSAIRKQLKQDGYTVLKIECGKYQLGSR
jgi:hypothetical protein